MSDIAGLWLRVSTNDQTEASQLPDLIKWCESHGYAEGKRYVLHGKSAYKGKQDAFIDQVIADMRARVITVLIVWASDRIERRGAYNAFDLARRVAEVGGRIEYVLDSYLNEASEMSDVMLAMAATKDRSSSRRLSTRIKANHQAIRSNGGVIGRAPWGMVPSGPKLNKRFVPTPVGRQWVPAIFEKCIGGASCGAIAAWLKEAGVAPEGGAATWSPKSIDQALKNPAYIGRPRTGGTCEALVSAETFASAARALATRNRKGGGHAGSATRAPALLTSWLHCGSCGGPMYRVRDAYRCCASPKFGAERRSECAFLIPIEAADRIAKSILSTSTEPVMELVWQDGDTSALQLAELDADEADLMRRKAAKLIGMAVFIADLEAIEAKRAVLAEAEAIPGRMVPVATGDTYGELAASAADDAALRDLMRTKGRFIAKRPGDVSVTVPAGEHFPAMVGGGVNGLPFLVWAEAGAAFPIAA